MPRLALFLFAVILLLPGCGSVLPDRQGPPAVSAASGPPPRTPQRYAVLVNGDSERRHRDNIRDAYRTLRSLGFAQDNIYVLTPRERRSFPENAPRLSPVADEFFHVMDRLAGSVRKGDIVLVYGTGHGDISEGESFLALRGEDDLWAWDLRQSIDKLGGDTVVVMDQCFSGGFSDAIDGTHSRAIAIATVDGQHETDCEYFAKAFWNAFLHPEHADRNHDRKVSVREAFELALIAHQEALADDKTLASNASCRSFNGLDDAVLN